MANPIVTNRTDRKNIDQKLIAGITKHAATLPPLVILGKTYAPPDLVAALQKRIDTGDVVVTAKAAYEAAVKADIDERASTKAFVSGLVQALRIAFSSSLDTLADFGITPRKARTPLTAEEKAAAKAKAKATRAARHIMSKKQRMQITGTVVVPPAPAAPATSTSTVVSPSAANGNVTSHG